MKKSDKEIKQAYEEYYKSLELMDLTDLISSYKKRLKIMDRVIEEKTSLT